jgi:hypothetical protein
MTRKNESLRLLIALSILPYWTLVAGTAQAQIFGGTEGGGIFGGQGGRFNDGEGGGFDVGRDVVAPLIQGLLDGANNNDGGFNPNNNDFNPNDGGFRPNRPQFIPDGGMNNPPVRRRPAPRVQRNKLPAEKPLAAKANPLKRARGLAQEQYGAIDDQAELEERRKLDSIKKELGSAAMDPTINAKLDELDAKVAAGDPITQQDIDDLNQAMMAAGVGPTEQLAVNQQLGEAKALSELRVALQNGGGGGNPGGGPPTLPTGPTVVIYNPNLPAGDVFVLPDGTLMVGTGGQGTLLITDGSLATALGMPLGVGEPFPSSEADLVKRVKRGVLVFNPPDNEESIQFICNNASYTLKPGFTQHFPNGPTWACRFDRGGSFGQANYNMKAGTYTFGPSDRGWELYRKSYNLTIDNSENAQPFYYTLDNKAAEVAAGGMQTHTAMYPILLRFDRGDNGKVEQKRITARESTLKVAISPADGLWDLFPIENFALADATDPSGAGSGQSAVQQSNGAPAAVPQD